MNLAPLAKGCEVSPWVPSMSAPCISYSGRGGHWVGVNVRAAGHCRTLTELARRNSLITLKCQCPGGRTLPDIDREISMSGSVGFWWVPDIEADIDRAGRLQAACPAPRPIVIGRLRRPWSHAFPAFPRVSLQMLFLSIISPQETHA
jgi:hypothetical protein